MQHPVTLLFNCHKHVLGKYLKLVYEHHEKAGTLDSEDVNMDGELDVLDLGAIFHKG